jgi:type II secretory pathway pseudopilin PulG
MRSSVRGQRGVALIALMASVTVMMIGLAVGMPAWKYVVKNDKEEELIFRGSQIANGIRRYQAKNGNALPASLDVLVKGKFLRRAYKDPMTKDGQWRLIRQGEALPGAVSPTGVPGRPGSSPSPSPSPAFGQSPRPNPSPSPSSVGPSQGMGPGGTGVGAFVGVASRSTEKGLRLVNNRENYNEWAFLAGQQIVVGNRVIGAPQQQAQPGRGGQQQPQQRPGTVTRP